jgi:Protein of unknown function (DUF4238)
MADFKNQHYVPRCLLKPFSFNGAGRALNLYNIGGRRLIKGAPLKSQCARDYLYDKDGKIEHSLASLEGNYSQILQRVTTRSETPDDLDQLRFFAYLQLRRTEMAMEHLKNAHQSMHGSIFGEGKTDRLVPHDRHFMALSLLLCFETRQFVDDLKVRIVENRAAQSFVISDDPAVLTNKYGEQKLHDSNHGISSSGIILVMPLTPALAVLCYDGQVYTVPNLQEKRIVLTGTSDVGALNELQYLKAGANIYFSEWLDRDYVRTQFEAVRGHRLTDWAATTCWVPLRDDEPKVGEIMYERSSGKAYRVGTTDEGKKAGEAILTLTFKHPVPSRWLSCLKYRSKPKTFYDGTAVGHVRQKKWLTAEGRG